ncbi:MAG: hypothetical protein Q4G49_02060 [Paracoccus sp. (in: a-proteobacteria)]|nr:hypothetical protein [Paracoccus sp. (in: a-proteobacteria)]
MTLLVMTATIKPPSNALLLTRTHVGARIEDYRRGLRHNLALVRAGVVSGVVFVDNSGHGTAEMQETVADEPGDLAGKVELISYDAQLDKNVQTRFAGECKLLSHAFQNSRMILTATASHVWKVTGRYVVRNLGRIISADYGDSDLIVHCRNRPSRFVDFGLAGFRRNRATELIGRVLDWPDVERLDESIIRKMIDGGSFDDIRVAQRFAAIPDFSGVRGSDSASYDGLAYRAKFMARVTANRLFPRLWI